MGQSGSREIHNHLKEIILKDGNNVGNEEERGVLLDRLKDILHEDVQADSSSSSEEKNKVALNFKNVDPTTVCSVIKAFHVANARITDDELQQDPARCYTCVLPDTDRKLLNCFAEAHGISSFVIAFADICVVLGWDIETVPISGQAKWRKLLQLEQNIGQDQYLSEQKLFEEFLAIFKTKVLEYMNISILRLQAHFDLFHVYTTDEKMEDKNTPIHNTKELQAVEKLCGYFVCCYSINHPAFVQTNQEIRRHLVGKLTDTIKTNADSWFNTRIMKHFDEYKQTMEAALQSIASKHEKADPAASTAQMSAAIDEETINKAGILSESLSELDTFLQNNLWQTMKIFLKYGILYHQITIPAIDANLAEVCEEVMEKLNIYQRHNFDNFEHMRLTSSLSLTMFKSLQSIVQNISIQYNKSLFHIRKELRLGKYEDWFDKAIPMWAQAWQLAIIDYCRQAIEKDSEFEKTGTMFNFTESGHTALTIFIGIANDFNKIQFDSPSLKQECVRLTAFAICNGVKNYSNMLFDHVARQLNQQTQGKAKPKDTEITPDIVLRVSNSIDHVGDTISAQLPVWLKCTDYMKADFLTSKGKVGVDITKNMRACNQHTNRMADRTLRLYSTFIRKDIDEYCRLLCIPPGDDGRLRKALRRTSKTDSEEIIDLLRKEVEFLSAKSLPTMVTVGINHLAEETFSLIRKHLVVAQSKEYYAEVKNRVQFLWSIFESEILSAESDGQTGPPPSYKDILQYLDWWQLSERILTLEYCKTLSNRLEYEPEPESATECCLFMKTCAVPNKDKTLYTILIQISRITKFPALDADHLSDPYVKFLLWPHTVFPEEKYKPSYTKTKRNTLNPVFDENLVIEDICSSDMDEDGAVLMIVGWDKDTMSHDDVGGRLCIPLKTIIRLELVESYSEAWKELAAFPKVVYRFPPSRKLDKHNAYQILQQRSNTEIRIETKDTRIATEFIRLEHKYTAG